MKTLNTENATIEDVLRYHAKAYPRMRPTDAVKLLYQNEFGGGHLIENADESLSWLETEFETVTRDARIPLSVPIGNGLVRVNLAAIDVRQTPLSKLNGIFVESSKIVCGKLCSLKEKIAVLQRLTDIGVFAFDASALDEYLVDYALKNYPAVSHSEEYRKAYSPSYRVVLNRLLTE